MKTKEEFEIKKWIEDHKITCRCYNWGFKEGKEKSLKAVINWIKRHSSYIMGDILDSDLEELKQEITKIT